MVIKSQGAFGQMGIANVGATTGATCAISTNIPGTGFVQGQDYQVWLLVAAVRGLFVLRSFTLYALQP